MQEIALASKVFVHCGPDHKDWNAVIRIRFGIYDTESRQTLGDNWDFRGHGRLVFRDFRISVHTYWQQLEDDLVVFLDSQRQQQRIGQLQKWSIAELALMTKDRLCEDQLDRIYALLSLEARRPNEEDIQPNYQIEVPVLFVDLLKKRSRPSTNRKAAKQSEVFDAFLAGLKVSRHQRIEILRSLPMDRQYPVLLYRLVFRGRYTRINFDI